MSRTYRRTKRTYVPEWIKYNWTSGGKDWLEGDELKKKLNEYHSDAYYTMRCSPPKWWRTMHWQCERRKANREVHRWMRNEEYEPQVNVNPGWSYWW